MQRLRAEARSGEPEGFVRSSAPAAAQKSDDVEVKADVPNSEISKAEPAKETPKPVEFSDDPASWPEQARKAFESTRAETTRIQEQIAKYEEIAPRAIEQNMRLAEELKLWRALGEQNGMSLDPRDIDLVGYRVKENNAQKMAEAAAQREQFEAQRAQEARKAQAATQAQSWLVSVQQQAKAAGVDFQDVATILHSHVAAKRDPDVAGAIEWAKAKQLAKQREVNASVPTSIKTSVPAGTTLPRDRTTQGRLDRLRQLGHEV